MPPKSAQLIALEMFNMNIVRTTANWSNQQIILIAKHPCHFSHNKQKWSCVVLILEPRWNVRTREYGMWEEGDILAVFQVNLV